LLTVDQNFQPERKPFSNGLAAVEVAQDSYQYIDTKGNSVFKTRFKTAGAFTPEGYAIVSTEAGTGLIDKKGAWVVKPNIDIREVAEGVIIYQKNQNMGVKDLATQKDIVPPVYSSIERVGPLLRLRNTGASSGYINTQGEFVIQPQFNTAWPFENDKAVVETNEGLFYIDKTGKKVGKVPDDKSPYNDGTQSLYVSNDGAKFGFDRSGGEEVVPARYDFATDFEGPVARVNIGANFRDEEYVYAGGKWGLINRQGNAITPPGCELIMPFHNGTAMFNNGGQATYSLCEGECDEYVYYSCTGGKWGLLNEKGTVVLEAKYDRIIPFGDNFLAGQEGKYTLLDATGAKVYDGLVMINLDEIEAGFIPMWYDLKFTTAWQDGLAGILNNTGKWLVKPAYASIVYKDLNASTPFTEGLVAVQSEEKWGAVDEAGTLVIPAEHDALRNFSSGMAAVMDKGKWGFINKSNVTTVEPVYAAVRDFQGEVAIVQREEESPESVITNKGTTVLAADPTRVFSYEGFVNGLCIISPSGEASSKSGVVNSAGKVLFNQNELTGVKIQTGGLLYAIKQDKWAMATTEGVMLTGFDYNWIETYTGQELIRCNAGGEVYQDEYGESESAYAGLWGMIDKKGTLRIPLKYAELDAFSNGLAQARSGQDLDEVGYIDFSGKVVSPLRK
jgi:hypothetical protein